MVKTAVSRGEMVMSGLDTSLARGLQLVYESAMESLEMAEAVGNETAAAALLRRRMRLIARSTSELIEEANRAKVEPLRKSDPADRQSTEESIRLEFSGIYFH